MYVVVPGHQSTAAVSFAGVSSRGVATHITAPQLGLAVGPSLVVLQNGVALLVSQYLDVSDLVEDVSGGVSVGVALDDAIDGV